MSFEQKNPASASNFEVDPRDITYQQQQGTIRLLNGICVGLTALALVSGITILGTSANAILVYNNTHVSSAFNLALWPEAFDLRPTVAQVVGSSIIILASLVSLIFSRVQVLHNQRVMHTSLTFIAPFVGFVAALIGISFYYGVNASSTVDTLQSWSCRWSSVNMRIEPYFGTLCRQSQTALYLSVILVPVELVILAAAGVQMSLERKASVFIPERKPSSPALS
ncbi:hypothetical protein F5B22DRAFT_293509 [Xylaria bambusicola]|uniref:uncharacterized protein n=1 Tax=Xylaria bambusicola TaxID=326684 RepID=UPI002008E1FF|nr:uncharacterized protein F5B22DRAFT_293509 [Xylaria bambusicola]KAI0512790.1 hypothetical protein F5B22DRAFT_293509 [Xylaria bambusicola]